MFLETVCRRSRETPQAAPDRESENFSSIVSGLYHSRFGGNGEEGPPVPIPNTEVKLFIVDGTARAAWWESRMPPTYYKPFKVNALKGFFISLTASAGSWPDKALLKRFVALRLPICSLASFCVGHILLGSRFTALACKLADSTQ